MFLNESASELNLPAEFVDMFLVHPPYPYTPKVYGDDDKQLNRESQTKESYLSEFVQSINNMAHALKPDGNIFVIFPNNSIPFDISSKILSETNLIIERTIIWNFINSPFVERNGIRGDEYCIILNLSKGNPRPKNNSFNNFVIDLPWIPENENVKEFESLGFVYDCIPEELARILIDAYTNPGDTVGDIYGGTGTVCVVAKKMYRDFVYNDVATEQYAVAKARINSV